MVEGKGGRERRCPNCGALIGADATWCGQCFSRLEDEPGGSRGAPEAPTPSAEAGSEGRAGQPPGTESRSPNRMQPPTWPCPTCGFENPIAEDACATCGTPFSALFAEGPNVARIEPRKALVRSLIFPGLGHAALGRSADAVARAAMFIMILGLTAVVIASRPSSVGIAVLILYLCGALATYVFSALEAYRSAQGERPWLTSRQLLWVMVALVIVSVMLLAGAVIAVPKGG